MRHEHLVVTVEAGLKERIDDDLDAGESLESWVADAIERKLERAETGRPDLGRAGGEGGATESGTDHPERAGRFGTTGDDERSRRGGGGDGGSGDGGSGDGGDGGDGGDVFDRTRDGFDADEGDDEYDEGFEYVDDCSI